jgi:hypothetical protein
MPLVISNKAKRVFAIRNEEVLGEILGHRDFDGEDWAIGDVIVFEDGDCALIELSDDGQFHVWSARTAGDLSAVLAKLASMPGVQSLSGIRTWKELFDGIRELQSRVKPTLKWRSLVVALVVSLFLGLALWPAHIHGAVYYARAFEPLYVGAGLLGVVSKMRGLSVLFAVAIALLFAAPFLSIPLMMAFAEFGQS